MVKKILAKLISVVLSVASVSLASGFLISILLKHTFGIDFSYEKITMIFIIIFIYMAVMNLFSRIANSD